MEIKDTTIRCIKKDERIQSVDVGDVGQLLEKDTTVMNTWYWVLFPATETRAETKTYYREPEFKEFFEEIPKFQLEISRLQQAVDGLYESIKQTYATARAQEAELTRTPLRLAEILSQKTAYERKWAR